MGDVASVELDGPGCGFHELQHRSSGGGLATAALAHAPQRLALAQIEGNAVHRPQAPFPEVELDVQIVDLEQR